MSDYDTEYNFASHLVVIGSYNNYYLWDFIKNFFSDKENKKLNDETKVIIVGEDEPSENL